MKLIGRKNSKFNKWFLKLHPFFIVHKGGEVVSLSRVSESPTDSHYYEMYEAYQMGLKENEKV